MMFGLVGSSLASQSPFAQLPIPLVEKLQSFPETPRGYVAYEVRIWGSSVIGRAANIAYSPDSKSRISITLSGTGSLEPRETLDPLAPSIIFVPSDVILDERVSALKAGPKGPPTLVRRSIVFVELKKSNGDAFREFTFVYPSYVFSGTIKSLTISKRVFNSDGTFAGNLQMGFEPDFSGKFSDSHEASIIRVPKSLAIPTELLPRI